MGILHSIILLVTLLFVLTTRGITLDIPTAIRNSRIDPSTIVPQPSTPSVPFPKNRKSHLERLRESWDRRPGSRESIQSAPASPVDIREWNTPPSSQGRFYSPSDDENVIHSDGDYPGVHTMGNSSQEYLIKGDSKEIMERYPTPTSDVAYE
jgi:hypothetical protein